MGYSEDWGLVALQGPLSAQILTRVLSNPEDAELEKLYFRETKFLQIKLADGKASEPLLISRGRYTGEDGFEISISPAETNAVFESLFQAAGPEQLRWASLRARDSLRLEAGMCLYGHDLDESTTPLEAALG